MNAGELLAELKAKPGEAAALAAGVVLVAVLAIRKRSSAAAATTAAAAGGTLDPSIAGLSGTPNTGLTDLASQFDDQLATLQDQIRNLTPGSSSSTSSGSGKPAGDPRKPGYQLYRLSSAHDSLRSLAQYIYGIATPGNIQALLAANPGLKFKGKVTGDAPIIGNRGTGIWAPLPTNTPAPPAAPAPAPTPAPPGYYVHPQGSDATPVRPATVTVAQGQPLQAIAAHHYGAENGASMAAALAAHNSVPATTNRAGTVEYHTVPGQRLDML